MKRNIGFALLFIFSICLSVGSAFAWTLVDQSGSWVLCTREHWIKQGWNDGYVEWNHTQADFNGYWFKVNITTWENWREWWQIGVFSIGSTWNDFTIKIKIHTAETTLWVITYWNGYTSWFGLCQGRIVKIGASVNASTWDDVKVKTVSFEGYDYWTVRLWNPTDLQIFIKNEDGKLKVYWLFTIPNQSPKYAQIIEFNQTLGTSADLTLIYQHDGYGKIEGYASDSFTLPYLPGYELKGKTNGFLDWFSFLSNLDYGGIISTLMVCVTIFFSFVHASIPILGFLVLFWILDCIISGIVHGEPRIIGDMVMTIYDFIRGVWQTLVNIAHALWDLITFWS